MKNEIFQLMLLTFRDFSNCTYFSKSLQTKKDRDRQREGGGRVKLPILRILKILREDSPYVYIQMMNIFKQPMSPAAANGSGWQTERNVTDDSKKLQNYFIPNS